MRKLILMAIAGYVWKKFRDGNGRSRAGGTANGDEFSAASRPGRRVARKPANHRKTHLEGSTT